jgi:hypothetical protein
LQSTFTLLIPLAILFLVLVYYKVGYDARESSREIPDVFNWDYVMSLGFTEFRIPVPEPSRFVEVIQILPGVVLVFMEVAVLTAVSVAIATKVPMVVNMVTCLAIFMVGHLTPVLVEGGTLKLEFVQFMAQLISTILPTLEWFKVDSANSLGKLAPPLYLGVAAVYGAAYATAAILLGLWFFEDRDLA